MASAEELRRFATTRFVRSELGRGPDEWLWRRFFVIVETPAFAELHDEATRSVGEFVERTGWRALGAHLGYFDPPEPPSDEDRAVLRKVLGLPQVERWPSWFRHYANTLLEGASPYDSLVADLPNADPEAIAVFQSAIILAEAIRDPLIVALQWSILSGDSVLDGRLALPDARTLMAQFERDENEVVRDSLPQSVAGFFKFVEVAASFDNLFVTGPQGLLTAESLSPSGGISAIYTESVRSVLARATANLISWQLNLSDELTVRRLSVVVNAFWNLCETQLRQHLTPDESWSASDSREYLITMLERWRDRADPGSINREMRLTILEGPEVEVRGENTGRIDELPLL